MLLSKCMIEFFSDGKISGEGDFEQGKRQGKWTFYYRNGQIKAKVSYLNGALNLDCQWWRENGLLLQKGTFLSNVQIGFWQRFYDNGQVWDDGHYDNTGKKMGEWNTYDKNGVLKTKKNHKEKNASLLR